MPKRSKKSSPKRPISKKSSPKRPSRKSPKYRASSGGVDSTVLPDPGPAGLKPPGADGSGEKQQVPHNAVPLRQVWEKPLKRNAVLTEAHRLTLKQDEERRRQDHERMAADRKQELYSKYMAEFEPHHTKRTIMGLLAHDNSVVAKAIIELTKYVIPESKLPVGDPVEFDAWNPEVEEAWNPEGPRWLTEMPFPGGSPPWRSLHDR